MTIGIIGAMDEEIAHLKQLMEEKETKTVANVTFTVGSIQDRKIILLKSGIGKVNAAMATTILLEQYNPKTIINIGSAGGIDCTLQVGDVVIGEALVHHDVDVTAFDYEYGQVPQQPRFFTSDETLIEHARSILTKMNVQTKVGLIATGDSFMHDETVIEKMKEVFPTVLAVEMEGAAIAQVCYQYGIPFLAVRSLSDIAGSDSPISFDQFLTVAAQNATKLLTELIRTL